MKKACKTIIFLPIFLKFGNSFLCDMATKIATLLNAKVKGKNKPYRVQKTYFLASFYMFLASPCSRQNSLDQGLNLCPLQWKHGALTTTARAVP